MKKLLMVVVAAVAMGASADVKIGTVEMLTLVKNHPNHNTNKELVLSTEKDYKAKVTKLQDDLAAMQEEGKKIADEARNPMLSATRKTELEKQFAGFQERYMAAQQKLRAEMMRSEQDLRDLEARLLKSVTEDIRKRITKFAETNGYDFVLDSSASPFAKKEYDVTDAILKDMGADPATARKTDESK